MNKRTTYSIRMTHCYAANVNETLCTIKVIAHACTGVRSCCEAYVWCQQVQISCDAIVGGAPSPAATASSKWQGRTLDAPNIHIKHRKYTATHVHVNRQRLQVKACCTTETWYVFSASTLAAPPPWKMTAKAFRWLNWQRMVPL
jgi:hypothetical protein